MRMDARYIRRRKLWRDVLLMARTVPAVLAKRGAR
jgi:lipopolysaccharide/colanic/teichoic acid biosynthesis glycosyltransferase